MIRPALLNRRRVSEHLPERPAALVLRRCHHIAYHGHAVRRGGSKHREHGLEALSMYTATRSPRSRMQFLFDKGAQATKSGKRFCVNFIVSHRNPEMLLQCAHHPDHDHRIQFRNAAQQRS